uniref:G-patch domain-containing protein n=1 Tax=Wuchereria bancrofti TaxID=6293 RepID=A0A1I8EZL4_WUCBA
MKSKPHLSLEKVQFTFVHSVVIAKSITEHYCYYLLLLIIIYLFEAYAIVRNIPRAYHARHLRCFFSYYVESGRFHCFHYRHRPEIHIDNGMNTLTTSNEYKRFCCIISFKNEEERAACIRHYHLKFWIDEKGLQMPLKCFIFPLKSCEFYSIKCVLAILDDSSRISANLDFRPFIELKPPSLMPFGNVGTPTSFFLEQIRLCKLPPMVLKKLGIQTKKRRGKYGAVCFKYSGSEEATVVDCEEEKISSSSSDLNLCTPEEIADNKFKLRNVDEIEYDGDSYEEWERHETLHDDVTEQERIKPRKYEMEQEVTWEKGGPGLVWYTDTFFWKKLEEGTDNDWKWADDWDVDYSIYYDRKEGDLDAKHSVEMAEDQKLRSGEVEHSVFKKKTKKRHYENIERPLSAVESIGFGQFETHTKGIGSKIMKSCGWSPGLGLGPHNLGRLETVSVEIEEGGAQTSNEKKGLGYRGEKLQRTGFFKAKNHTIATKYDQWNFVDNNKSISKVLRTEPDFMKYR